VNSLKAFIFGLVAIVLILGSAAALISQWQFGLRSTQTVGRVLLTPFGPAHPTVQFTDAENKQIEFPGNGFVYFNPGDAVAVRYDSKDSRRAVVDTFGARYAFTLLFLLLGFVFGFVSWRIRVGSRR
jgi:hypothetical protein